MTTLRAWAEGPDGDRRLAAWADARLRPKVVVATQTRVVEAAVDDDGSWWPSVPVISVVLDPDHDDDETRWLVAAALSAPPVSAWAAERSGGTALAPQALKLSARQVLEVPLPVDRDAWAEGARLLRLVGPQFAEDARARALLAAGAGAHRRPRPPRRPRPTRCCGGGPSARVVGVTFSANLTPMLAGKEVKRAKLRFGLLSGAVGLLVFLILFQQALLGSLLLSFTGALENQSGTVLVFSEEARKNVSGSVILPPQQAQIAAVDGVGASAPLAEGTFTIEADGDDVDASVFGFQPGGPGEPTRMVEGRLPTTPSEAVASKEDASAGFGLGDTVTSVDGDIPLTIVGLTERSRFSVAPTLWVTFDGYTALRKASNPDATAVLPSVIAVTPADGVSACAARRLHRRPGRRRAGAHPQPGRQRGSRRLVGEHLVPADPRPRLPGGGGRHRLLLPHPHGAEAVDPHRPAGRRCPHQLPGQGAVEADRPRRRHRPGGGRRCSPSAR